MYGCPHVFCYEMVASGKPIQYLISSCGKSYVDCTLAEAEEGCQKC